MLSYVAVFSNFRGATFYQMSQTVIKNPGSTKSICVHMDLLRMRQRSVVENLYQWSFGLAWLIRLSNKRLSATELILLIQAAETDHLRNSFLHLLAELDQASMTKCRLSNFLLVLLPIKIPLPSF